MRPHRLIASTPQFNTFEITWPPGHGLDWHDHGDSSASFRVIVGVLHEELDWGSFDHVPGTTVYRSAGVGHRVVNTSSEPAVSVHSYYPPLTRVYSSNLEIFPQDAVKGLQS